MQLPEKVNFNWQSVLQQALLDNTINIHEIVSENSEIAADLKNADTSFEYWDKARYAVLPANISSELFWSIIKFRRSGLYAEKIKLGINTFKYLINPEILKKIAFAESFNLKTQLSLDEENEYSANAKMEEAIASCRLEGAQAARKEAKEMLRKNTPAKNESERMIINNYRALNFIEKNAGQKLTADFIKQIHAIMTNSQETDIFRKDSHVVRVVDIRDDEVLYEPPKAADIETLLSDICDYANAESGANHIIKAAAIHFLFAYLHPFNDGNGRISRALFYWYVLRNDLNAFKYLALSKILRAAPSQYAKVFLYTEIDENDLTYFVNFILDVIMESVNNFNDYLENKTEENKNSKTFEPLLKPGLKLNPRQESIMRDFAANQVSRNIEYFKNKLGIVYETARKDLMFLAKKGMLAKTKKGKEFVYSLSKKSLRKLIEDDNGK
ncbi:MAG: Fic family protein [Endomicrobia bacterium]|nr:Fic family protein [Endomicrobiia bacterium]